MSAKRDRTVCAFGACERPARWLPVAAIWADATRAHDPLLAGFPRAGHCDDCKPKASIAPFLTASVRARVEAGCVKARKALPDWSTVELRWHPIDDPLFNIDRGGERYPGGRRFAL